MVELLRPSTPGLIPLFRSDEQIRVLAALFLGGAPRPTIRDIADLADISKATASREIQRLADYGLVRKVPVGRSRVVLVDWETPYLAPLRQLVVYAHGLLMVIGDALAIVEDLEEAWIFGSWAARHDGEPGPYPRDLDLLVVGEPSLFALEAAVDRAQVDLELPIVVNPIAVSAADWNGSITPFVEDVRERPLVRVPLRRSDA